MKTIKNLKITALLAVMALVLTGCRWGDDRDFDQIIGHWVSDYTYDGYRTYDAWDVEEYYFHRNGEGEYSYVDEWGVWVTYRFTWDTYRDQTIELRFPDRTGYSYVRYYYEWDRDGDLLLSLDRNMREYMAFRYMR